MGFATSIEQSAVPFGDETLAEGELDIFADMVPLGRMMAERMKSSQGFCWCSNEFWVACLR